MRTKINHANLLGVLESAFPCGVEKPNKVAAAHVADFVDAVIARHRLDGGKTYRMKLAMSLAVR